MDATELGALVGALSELYQPVFGHEEFDAGAVRPCADRLALLEPIVRALGDRLGRPVRILDLGCAQGYFSLSLAAAGAHVRGVDREAHNIALCRALAAEHPELDVSFVLGSVEEEIARVVQGEFDVVLALNVFHHVCHEHGFPATRQMLRDLADKVDVFLAELALRIEPLYWAESLPADPRELLADFGFVHAVAHFPNHLSHIVRPLFFASSRWWWLDAKLHRFESWTAQSHELAGDFHLGSRRYYFGGDRLAKYFVFAGDAGDRNRLELGREIEFLSAPPPGLERLPALRGHALDEHYGWLVRELLPGRRLSELIASAESFDRERVLDDVLDALVALEAAGLYHGDMRIWNVIVDADGRSSIIDYGEITTSPECAWPGNVFLSFLIFVHELFAGSLPRILPMRTPSFAPEHFSEPHRSWIASIWRVAPADWSFRRMRDLLERPRGIVHVPDPAPDQQPVMARTPGAGSAWAAAIEQYIEVLAARQQAVFGESERPVVDELMDLRAELQRARADLAARDADRAQSHANAAALRGALSAIEQQLAGKDARLAALDRAIEDARARELALLREAERERGALEHRISVLDAECARQRHETHRWWQATAEVSEELRVVYGTLSWRVTAPLRWLKKLFARTPERDTGAPSARRGWVRASARFVRARPGLHAWIGRRLDRFPAMKRRLKGMESGTRADHASGLGGGSQQEGDAMGRAARSVHEQLTAAIDRRRETPGEPRR